jgi:hypothetical protein
VIGDRLKELAEYADDLDALLNIYVVEPSDTLADLDDALGFAVEDRPHDVIGVHPACYEVTWVLADDGFGVVLYVPRRSDIDPALLEVCAKRAAGAAA